MSVGTVNFLDTTITCFILLFVVRFAVKVEFKFDKMNRCKKLTGTAERFTPTQSNVCLCSQ